MIDRSLRVLHITPDDKFFDSIFSSWEQNEDFENKAFFYTQNRDYTFVYIKRTDILEIFYNEEDAKQRLQKNDYDIVLLHSMPGRFYQFVGWIPTDRIVIWWGWGYDIYQSQLGLPPIVRLNLFKERTSRFSSKPKETQTTLKQYVMKIIRIKQHLKSIIIRRQLKLRQDKILKRIDYYIPVVKSEIDMMQKHKLFKAKEFYHKPGIPNNIEFVPRPTNGKIILGNSCTPTNNHLDVLEVVQKFKQDNQAIFMPLNYGNEKYKIWLKPHLQHPDIQPIYDFLPREEYFQILNSCSYAIYGSIRQQAMGNINYALSKGIKVFLYKDSVAYKNFINLGYVVFSIEDMTAESLRTPLTQKQMEQNNKARQKESLRRMKIYHRCINEIRNRIKTDSLPHTEK